MEFSDAIFVLQHRSNRTLVIYWRHSTDFKEMKFGKSSEGLRNSFGKTLIPVIQKSVVKKFNLWRWRYLMLMKKMLNSIYEFGCIVVLGENGIKKKYIQKTKRQKDPFMPKNSLCLIF